MVMRGFKSFAKHTELVFGKDFNSVIGPNGSGKSNILDSLCFVLGKSSAKSMRAEKSANLIYNGGKQKSPGKEGEVSIYFDNGNKIFPTDDPEVKISRMVRQNGQSIYKINDKVRTRQEMIDLLGLAKINPDGYNIILQGDIVRFVEMPPVERRQLVEEIAGISSYEDKKQKAVSQLDKVQERLKEAEIVLAERNTYLRELKKDRDQAQKFKDMENKVSQNSATLLNKQIGTKKNDKKKLSDELEKTKAELLEINNELQSYRSQITQKKEEIEAIGKEIEEKGEREQVTLNRDIEHLRIELVKKKTRLESITKDMERVSKRRDELKESSSETQEKIETLKLQETKEKEQFAKVDKQRNEIIEKINKFRSNNNLDGMADVEKKIESIDKEAEALQHEVQSLREKQHSLIREKDVLEHSINTLDEQIAKVEELEKEHKQEIGELKSKRKQFKEATLQLNTCLNDDGSLVAQIARKRKDIGTKRENLAKLEARAAQIKETTKLNPAMDRVLALKEQNPGILGTVFELGTVDAKYATALEKAAGQRMKSIIVENDKVASHLIKYLKENKLGTVTFLPLSVMQSKPTHPEAKKIANAKGAHGLAIDLIQFEPKLRSAFSYIFHNTIVIDDIDVARRLGIGKAKMVTLDGDLADRSGAMTGGYHAKSRNLKFSEKQIDSNIETAESDLAEDENALSLIEQKRGENEGTITKLRQEKASLEGEIIKVEKSLHLEAHDIEATLTKKEDLEKSAREKQQEIETLLSTITDKNKLLTENRIEKQQLRYQISKLRDPRLVAELATFEEVRNRLHEEITQIDSNIKHVHVQINEIHGPEQQKAEKTKELLAKEDDELKTEQEYIERELKTQEKALVEKEEVAKEFNKKYRQLFEKRSLIEQEKNELEANIMKRSDGSRQTEIRENTLSLKHAEAASELAGMHQEFLQYEGVQLIENKTEEQLKYEISKFEKMKADIGSVNMRALEIYGEVEKEYLSLLEKKETLNNEREDVMSMMEEIEGKKRELFKISFDAVNTHFKEIFSRLSTKGDAILDMENPEDPFEGGVGIKVRMAGKRFLDIRSLSGGEKTMTALAFIFAIQEHEPASFYILDEVDAALDQNNAEKFGKLIQKYSERAQYIMISHNDSVINMANTLYGVSMNEHGMSKVVSLKV